MAQPPPAVDPRFGPTMRALRQERGLSLRALEVRARSNRSSLSEYETGRTMPSADTAQLIDDALSAGGVLSALVAIDQDSIDQRDFSNAPVSGGRLWLPSDTTNLVSRFTREDLAVERRKAISGAAGILFGAALLERLERWLHGGSEAETPSPSSGIGYDEVAQIESAAQIFRTWDNDYGGGLMRKAVIGQLSEVADEIQVHRHPVDLRRRLFGVMAQLASIAATMSWDSGRGATAQQYYLLALRSAKESGDRAFGANILAGMSRQLLYLGRPVEALEMIRLAQDGSARHATARQRAMLYTREAWAYAAQGRIEAFRRATAKAEDALGNAKPAEDPHWITYFDEAELAGTTGGRLLELAHRRLELAQETAEHIDQAVRKRRGLSLRSSALDKIGLAEARLVQDEPEEAARLGFEAAAVAAQTQSDRVQVKLVEFYRYTDRYANHPSVADLRPRLRELAAIA